MPPLFRRQHRRNDISDDSAFPREEIIDLVFFGVHWDKLGDRLTCFVIITVSHLACTSSMTARHFDLKEPADILFILPLSVSTTMVIIPWSFVKDPPDSSNFGALNCAMNYFEFLLASSFIATPPVVCVSSLSF